MFFLGNEEGGDREWAKSKEEMREREVGKKIEHIEKRESIYGEKGEGKKEREMVHAKTRGRW